MSELATRYASIRASCLDLPQSYAATSVVRHRSFLKRIRRRKKNPPIADHCMRACDELLGQFSPYCEHAEDGALLAPLEDGYMLAVMCADVKGSYTFEAIEKCFVIVLALRDVRSFYFIALALWGNRNFFDGIGDVAQLRDFPHQPNLPPGFDCVVNDLLTDRAQRRVNMALKSAPRWVLQVQKRLSGVRDFAARITFEAAVQFVLSHEMAHVLQGYVSRTAVEFSKMAWLGEVREQDFPYWGIEIEADRWASMEAQRNARSTAPAKVVSENRAVVIFLGCVITFLLQHGKAELSAESKAHVDRKHPPLWFRGYDLILQYIRTGGDFSHHEDKYYACLDAIADRDRLFATWLHPIRDREPAMAASTIAAESLAALQTWSKNSRLKVYAFRKCS